MNRLAVEDLFPGNTAVGRLGDAAGRGAGVIEERIACHTGDGADAIALRTDMAPRQPAVHVGCDA
jgi:hypothetical protein